MSGYAYFTVGAIVASYMLFAVISLRIGRWYYLFLHPFAVTCLYWFRIYRLRSDIPEIALRADIAIAVSVLASAVAFFLAYCFFKETRILAVVEKYNSLIKKNSNETDGTTYGTFWFFVVFIMVSFAVYYGSRYCYYGNVSEMFFEVYNRNSFNHSINFGKETTSFWRRLPLLVSLYLNHTLMYCGIGLMFECFRKRGTLRSLFSFWTGVLMAFLTCTSLMGLGYRTMPFYVAWVIMLLTIASIYVPSQRITKWAIPLIVFFLCYSLFAFLVLQNTRSIGIGKIITTVQNFLSKEETRKDTISSIVAKNDNQFLRLDQDLVIDVNLTSHHVNVPMIPFEEIKIDQTLQAEPTPQVGQTPQTDQSLVLENKPIHAEQDRFLKERKFLLSNRRSYGWASSRFIAWNMLWFGRHQEFVGFGNTQLCTLIIPRKVLKLQPSDLYMDMARFGKPYGSTLGPFGSGYIDYGFIGGYFNCILWGVICGFLAKIGMTLLFHDRTPIEFRMVASGLAVSIPVVLGANSAALMYILIGFTIIAICYSIFLVFSNVGGRRFGSADRRNDG